MMKHIFSLIFLASLAACSSVPDKLSVADDALLIDYRQAKAEVNANIGFKARWGGVIARVENQAEKTMIEVVNLTLSPSAKPKQSQETEGRFRLYHKGLLDPVIYKQGKSITVLGTIAESESGKIGEQEYLFPVLHADAVHLWKDVQRVDVRVRHDPLWYMGPYYRQPYYYGHPVIIKKSGKTAPNTKGTKQK